MSRITGYRLQDWLAVLGIDLDQAAGLAASLPLPRTRLIDSALDGTDFIVSTEGPETERPSGDVIPLGRLLGWVKPAPPVSGASIRQRSTFARIGAEDAFAFPELLPGSLVRIIPETLSRSRSELPDPPRLLLIEHERGLWCARFHFSRNKVIHAAASELPYAPITFQVPGEARVLGMVDTEIRWMDRFESPRVPSDFATYQPPRSLDRASTCLGALIRRARGRAGLTLREASGLTRRVSLSLGNEQYAIAESTLSEYEANDLPPRHVEKVITLCLVYGIGLMDFIAASGAPPELLGSEIIPPHLISGSRNATGDSCHGRQRLAAQDDGDAHLSMFSRWGDIPWFLRTAVADLSGIQRPSIRDFFLLSGDHPFLPPHTQGSLLALVNRRKRRPARLANRTSWQQPAYALLLRSGEYRCACCSLERGDLVLYPESDNRRVPEQLRLGRDAEVIGQIVALARSIR